MHQLIESWKESLLLFKPDNLKPLLQATFNSAAQTYKLLFRYFWWLMIVYIAIAYYYPYPVHAYYHAYPLSLHAANYIINWVIELFFVFMVFLAARPTTVAKNYAYFKNNLGNFIPIVGWGVIVGSFMLFARHTSANFGGPTGIIIGAFFYSINGAIAGLVFFWLILSKMLAFFEAHLVVDLILVGLLAIWLFPLMMFFVQFFLDSKKGPQALIVSIIRALKMTWYNYPFCFIVHMTFVVIGAVLNLIMRHLLSYGMMPIIHNIGIVFLSPIPICLFTVFYNKQIKVQYKIYFKERSSMWE